MRATAIILLITLLPALCFANGKVAAIKKGQTAPFDGILLDKKAEATMAAKRESAVKICEIDKNYTIKKLKAECDFNNRILTIEKESEKKKHDGLMALKNAEVKRLEEVLKKSQKPDYSKLWFVGGFVAGVGLSIGIFYAAAQASK
ncbi:MAG: hypothetical protein VW683_14325 [Betaproteobacteria bacterium]